MRWAKKKKKAHVHAQGYLFKPFFFFFFVLVKTMAHPGRPRGAEQNPSQLHVG